MDSRDQENVLVLAVRAAAFASNHPYLTSSIFGAAVGSISTYKILTRQKISEVFSPKVYELALGPNDMQALLADPTTELRCETATITVVITGEKREPLKQLPVIEGTVIEEGADET